MSFFSKGQGFISLIKQKFYMPKTEVKATGVWKAFFLSFILPIIGGLIVYFRNRKKNQELAGICLVLSIYHPLIIVSLAKAVIGDSNFLAGFLGVFISLLLTISLIKVFGENQNQYRYFIPVWYFGLFGAIYSYFCAYKNNKPLQKDVGWFFFGQVLIVCISIIMTIVGILFFWISS